MIELVNTQKITEVIAKSVTTVAKVLEDGKIDASDLKYSFEVFSILQSLPGINFTDFIIEIKKLNPEDIVAIVKQLQTEIDLPSEDAKKAVDFWINFTEKVYSIFADATELVKSFQK